MHLPRRHWGAIWTISAVPPWLPPKLLSTSQQPAFTFEGCSSWISSYFNKEIRLIRHSFAWAIAQFRRLRRQHSSVEIHAFQNDVYGVGHYADLKGATIIFKHGCESVNLEGNTYKSRMHGTHSAVTTIAVIQEKVTDVGSVRVVSGLPIGRTETFSSFYEARAHEWSPTLRNMQDILIDHRHALNQLFKYCIDNKTTRLVRVIIRSLVEKFAAMHDR